MRNTTPPRRWVFEELVKDENDFIGLIAYGLYKHKKHELAIYYKSQDRSDEQIALELRKFQEQSLVGDRDIETWRANATSLLATVIEEEKRVALEGFIQTVHSSLHPKKAWWKKLFIWFFSGIPSLVSAFLLMSLFYSFVAFSLPDHIFSSAVANLINKLADEQIVQPTSIQK